MPCTPKSKPRARSSRRVGGITCWSSRPTKADSSPKRNTSSRKIFPPQHLTVESGHGRIEWRGIRGLTVTPAQMGFPHAVQLARVDRWRFHKKTGKLEVETVWVVTS